MKTLLCIDDQAPALAIRKLMLEANGYRVLAATSGRQGLELVQANDVDLIILDYRMPDMDGEAVAREVKNRRPDLPIIMLTGAVIDFPPEIQQFVDGLVVKGQPPRDLLEMIEQLIGEKGSKKPLGVTADTVLGLSTEHVERAREVAKATQRQIDRARERRKSSSSENSRPGTERRRRNDRAS